MTIDPRLLAHPVLRAEAERRAREEWLVARTVYHESAPDITFNEWDEQVPVWRQSQVEIRARLLADLSRAESRDWLARQVYAADPRHIRPEWLFNLRDEPGPLVSEWLDLHEPKESP